MQTLKPVALLYLNFKQFLDLKATKHRLKSTYVETSVLNKIDKLRLRMSEDRVLIRLFGSENEVTVEG